MKKTVYSEAAYVIGILVLALGTAFMERADFGVSMVVAPAYLLHLKVSHHLPFFSFGMAEYVFQAFVLILLGVVMKRFKLSYLFSFVTAVLYGLALDGSIWLTALLPGSGMLLRVAFYVAGMVLCSVGVAFLFHTYIAPEAYELFVKELSAKLGTKIHNTKTVYDCCSCFLGIVMSFVFFGFGHFEGVKLGTMFCAVVNGWMIGQIGKILEKRLVFRDACAMRKVFSV